jgi:hypothetical protein
MDKDYRPDWRKATYSNGSGNCVEVGRLAGTVAVRDTTDRDGAVLRFSVGAWRAFAAQLKQR